MQQSYRDLLYSGALARLAKKHRTPAEVAEQLGVTVDALGAGLRRLRGSDETVPKLSDLFDAPASSPGPEPVAKQMPPVDEHRLKRKLKELESVNKSLIEQVASAEDRFALLNNAMDQRIDPLVIRGGGNEKKREGTAVFLISDLHLEEEVKPEKVNHMNKFNLDIARKRMTRLFQGIRWFIETQRQTFKIRDVCIWLGGDTFSSYLHDDNIEANLLAPPAAFAFAKQLISDGLKYVMEDDELQRIIIPANDGNHSRITKELRASSRAEMSMETIMYAMLADEFRGDKRVQFEIAQGDHLYTRIYDKTIRWTHGAEFKGGSGIGGIMIPIYRSLSRIQTVKHADITALGHFHQRISLSDLEVNGSLIGYTPYALRIGARYEEPSQSAFMMDSRRGKSVSAPIWVADQ